MSVIICGSTGILGSSLCKKIKNAITPTRSDIDYLSLSSIENFFKQYKVTTCINCIAERNLEPCEKNWDLTKNTNIQIPSNLYKVCESLGIHYIHISTDYIFDGTSPPYSPFSKPNPLQNYGISKLVAEYAIGTNATVIRVPVLYSEMGNDAIFPLIRKVMNSIESGFEDDYFPRGPVYIPDFCDFIIDMMHTTGTFHFWNPYTKITKYKMIQMIGEILNKDTSHIQPSQNMYVAGRPFDTTFIDPQHDIYARTHTLLRDGLVSCVKPFCHEGCDIFHVLDLDGTLIDTDISHYNAYKKAGLQMEWSEFEYALNTTGIHASDEIRKLKKEFMKSEIIKFIPGAEEFIKSLKNHVVVTNTSKEVVDMFKKQLPLLNTLNIITREEYSHPKPSPDGYKLGLERFYKNEKYIVGFENTVIGYNSLKNITKCIYIVTTKNTTCYSKLRNENVYFISGYN